MNNTIYLSVHAYFKNDRDTLLNSRYTSNNNQKNVRMKQLFSSDDQQTLSSLAKFTKIIMLKFRK